MTPAPARATGAALPPATVDPVREDAYRTLVESVQAIVWRGDARTFQFTFVSKEAEKLLGYPAERWTKEADFWVQHVHPDDKEWAVGFCKRATDELRSHEFEYRMIAADGRVVWLRDIVRVHAVDGKPKELFGVMIDVTDRHQAADAQRQALERVLEMKKQREQDTQLLRTATHEIHTPLSAIKAYLELLRSGDLGPLSDDQQRAVATLDRNVDRLTMLARDVLETARLQSGRLELRRSAVPLRQLVEEATEAFGEQSRAADVSLRWSVEGEPVVHADAPRVLQVMFNLLSNALKYTPPGGSIEVLGRADGSIARVEVSDTGPGLTMEQIATLFEPFSTGHVQDAPRFGASHGLGLYISRNIVEAHGGRIGCHSGGLGKGCTFAFSLPLTAMEEAVPAEAPA